MKFTQVFLIASLVVCASAIVILPEDFPQLNAAGQCPSGLPVDGTFESGSLGDGSQPNSWRVGAWRSGKSVSPADIMFQTGFTNFPSFFDIPSQSTQQPSGSGSSQFSVRVPSNGILFQYMNNIAYAHYRLRACARVHGETPCRIEVRNNGNEVVDYIDFLPEKNITSSCASSSSSQQQDCVKTCTADSTYSAATIRYTGNYPVTILLRLPGDESGSSGMMLQLSPGDEFNVTSDLFANQGNSSSSSNATGNSLPQFIEFVEWPGQPRELIDVFSANCSALTALPGMRFGDKRHFVVVRAWDQDQAPLCSVSEIGQRDQCACESESVQERCLLSDKGFVALPDYEYYIGLVSKDCSCSFDNVCLDWVNGDEGYFGLDWLLVRNSTTSTM